MTKSDIPLSPYISFIRRAAPSPPILTIVSIFGDLTDIIKCTKFCTDRLTGVRRIPENSTFLLEWKAVHNTVLSAAALIPDVLLIRKC